MFVEDVRYLRRLIDAAGTIGFDVNALGCPRHGDVSKDNVVNTMVILDGTYASY